MGNCASEELFGGMVVTEVVVKEGLLEVDGVSGRDEDGTSLVDELWEDENSSADICGIV